MDKHAIRTVLLTSRPLWIISSILTIACFTYQDKTGPTYPLEGDFQIAGGIVHFKFLRSEVIGMDLKIMLPDPAPEGVTGFVKFRRYKSDDRWSTLPLKRGVFEFSRRGQTESIMGIGAELPTLKERAGKYEYFVYIVEGNGDPVSVTGEKPIYARYKADVPTWVLIVHIIAIFTSMTFGIRTVLEALVDGTFKWMLWATVLSLLLGGFVFGPLVQRYAFGVWWSGVPYGYDWTDNKVLLELIFWLAALFMNRGKQRNMLAVYMAGVFTLIVYFIPHSIFGSEYNYATGTGHGTAG
jgi:hypothetical protein